MLALNYTPYFDLSEIITELTIPFKKYKPLTPLATGSHTPDFTLQKDNGKLKKLFNVPDHRNTIQLRDILAKPLVIAFYSQQWKSYGLDLLKNLNNLQRDVTINGGNLLIVTPEKETTEKTAWDNNLTLNFYFDKSNTIAEKFRIYSDKDPLWNRFSGIDANVPLLATYVISPSRQIVYNHIEQDFDETFPATNILSAVQQAHLHQ
jgi:peroxiredoxin